MDQQLVREIMASGSAMLTQMAEAAKTTGEHLYGVLVRQQVVEGVGNIVAISSYLIAMAFSLRWGMGWIRRSDSDDDKFLKFFLLCLLVICLFIAWGTMQTSLQQILNPEYYAIKFIIDSVQNK